MTFCLNHFIQILHLYRICEKQNLKKRTDVTFQNITTLNYYVIVLFGGLCWTGEVKSESEKQLEERQEEAFAIHSQERIMGLLGAMVPLVDQVRASSVGETVGMCVTLQG